MKKKILVVDDNRVMLKFLTNLLEREGHEVVTAEDGFSALDILTTYVPDILFVDLIMPKISGDKLCKIVRKMDHLKDCYVVVVSAAVAEMEFDYQVIGANTCIAKGPFPTMSKNVLTVIEKSDEPLAADRPKEIMGLDEVYARRMTKELLSRNRHLETILESISEGILEVYSGQIVYANLSATNLFGLPQEKILAARPVELFAPEVRVQVQQLLNASSNNSTKIQDFRPVELNGKLVTIRNLPVKGETATTIIIIMDVTEQKRLELQLQHVQKMEAIGTIASGVAHNFRNTLAGIMVNSQVLQMEFGDVLELSKITERINKSVKRGASLVEGLTQFSRKQTVKDFKKIDLTEIAHEIHQLVRESFDKKIEILMESPAHLFISGDHAGISQALMNLCTNARDAMPKGGELKIRLAKSGDNALIRVSDTGHGMSQRVMDKCFDPFFTTKEVGKGTGLGLSTTYGIIQGHNGEIRVDSKPGKGTRFELIFPHAVSEDLKPDPQFPKIIKGNGETILIVDDEIEILEAMPKLIEALGYRSELAGNAKDALTIYQSAHPDVVLMDRNMPDIDGVECAKMISDYDPDAIIVIISGYELTGPDGIDPESTKFIKGYLTKPVDVNDLSRLLKDLLDKSDKTDGEKPE